MASAYTDFHDFESDGSDQPHHLPLVDPLPTEAWTPRAERRKRSRRAIVATLFAALLHVPFLLAWNDRAASRTELVGMDGGGGGIALSLVSGLEGAKFTSNSADQGADVSREHGPTSPPPETSPSDASEATGEEGGAAAPAAVGHTAGGLAATVAPGAEATSGLGYDPGAYASLAPLSVAGVSAPGFLDQVRPCLKQPPPGDLTFAVVLGETGDFMGAYPVPSGSLNVSGNDPQAFADTIEAIRLCAPYKDMPHNPSKPIVLVIPANLALTTAAVPALAQADLDRR